ncbi:LDL receptor related protein 4 [Carabus blaptoides fortunei]
MSTFYISAHGKIHSVIACEGQKLKMSCYYGGMISVIGADYGRWNASVCPYYDDPNMDLQCHSLYAQTIIKTSCDGHTNCKFKVNNDNLMDPCPGQVKYAEVKYILLFAVAESSAYYDVENKITCEWQPMTLECNEGKVLKIMSANYGRTNDSLCGSFENTNCRASGSLSIIKNNCEGQTSCTVMATNYVFGDPCRGVVKYIEAEYQCVSAPACTANQFRCDDGKCMSKSLLCNGYPDCSEGEDEWECNVENKITCEWQPMTLECNRGKVLKIMSANYGRTNDSVCGLFEDTNCRASRSLSIIKNKCEGQTNCTVMATNNNFGDPCHGVVKYIEAEYQCVPGPVCTANQFKCDDGKCMSKLLLCNGYPDCSGGEDERGCRPVCTANQFKCDDGKCMSKSLLCNGYPDCSEGEDGHECNVENKITCEWQSMTLVCNRGKVLKIMSANYGRTNASLCEPFENINCRTPGSLSIIKNKCEGQTSCTVMATNYVFGDPCYGVVKYIEAEYQCVPDKIHSAIAYEGQSIDKKKSANSVYSPSFGDNLMKKGMYTLLTLLKGRN